MFEPLVSVVVPCRNRAAELPRTLDSILAQDYPRIEVIVADGGSMDGTPRVLAQYGQAVTWFSEADRGPFEAINRGWARSHGEILAWLNADDCWLPGAATRAVEAFRAHPGAAVVYGSAVGVDSHRTRRYAFPARPFVLEQAILHCDHVISQAASFIRREAVEAAGFLRAGWAHDQELWLRMAMQGASFVPIPDVLAVIRVSGDDAHMDAGRMVRARLAMLDRLVASPDFPPGLRLRQRRIRSNTWLRTLDSLQVRKASDWYWGPRALASAVTADPSNTGHVLAETVRRVRERVLPPATAFDAFSAASQTPEGVSAVGEQNGRTG